ncbi:hypothetical protein [Aeoliella sp.]|uniref:hypothetical protein n=1 Tax=Aeoliella sp. TaxID=2795800 RepID=UPI003CCBC608
MTRVATRCADLFLLPAYFIMTSPALLLLVPLLGVSFGYEPSSDAEVGYDYTVQVEPELLEQMKEGNAQVIESNIPPEVSPIRRIRVVVGTEPLAKKLRPGAVSRTTFRPEVEDAGSPSIDLLAQTGPAGGFGRNATGFNGSVTRGASQPNPAVTSAPVTVPPANPNPANRYEANQYTGGSYTAPPTTPTVTRSAMPDAQSQLDAGFEAAQNGFDNTRNAVRNTLNEMGATSERVINDTRQAMGDLIAPPDTRSASPERFVAPTTANAQDQFRNTTDAMRSSIDQATAANRGMVDRYGNPISGIAGSTPAPGWTTDSAGNPLQVADRSVMVSRGNNSATTTNRMTETQDEYWARMRQEQRQRELQAQSALAAEQQRTAAMEGPGFPEKRQMEALPEIPSGTTTERPTDLVRSMVPHGGTAEAHGPEPTAAPAITAASNRESSFNAPFENSREAAGNTAATDNSSPTRQIAEHPNYDFDSNTQRAGVGDAAVEVAKSTGVPAAVWAWAIAIASALVNAFQWINMVDLRNKYRVALRRSSPNFARSMAA